MDYLLNKAASLPGTGGVMVMDVNWVVIGSRGVLSEEDVPGLERLLSWMEEDATGEIAWGGEGSSVQFHRARTHTLVLLKGRAIVPTCSTSPQELDGDAPSSLQTIKAV